MGADTDVYNVILHQWLSIPQYLYKRSISMHITYDIMIGLQQLLYMCKAEKTHLNDRVATGGFCAQRTVADKVQKIGT